VHPSAGCALTRGRDQRLGAVPLLPTTVALRGLWLCASLRGLRTHATRNFTVTGLSKSSLVGVCLRSAPGRVASVPGAMRWQSVGFMYCIPLSVHTHEYLISTIRVFEPRTFDAPVEESFPGARGGGNRPLPDYHKVRTTVRFILLPPLLITFGSCR